MLDEQNKPFGFELAGNLTFHVSPSLSLNGGGNPHATTARITWCTWSNQRSTR